VTLDADFRGSYRVLGWAVLELEEINLTVMINEKAAETYQGLWGLASLQGRMEETMHVMSQLGTSYVTHCSQLLFFSLLGQ
jgi:hypothetical protein